MIDSISLVAQTAYAKLNNSLVSSSVKSASNFQDMINIQFNRFASMSPDQILSHINNVRMFGTDSVTNNGGIVEGVLSELRKKINHQEQVVRKSLVNQASLLDLVTTTNEAKNTLQTAVIIRDKFLEAFEKVMNMSI